MQNDLCPYGSGVTYKENFGMSTRTGVSGTCEAAAPKGRIAVAATMVMVGSTGWMLGFCREALLPVMLHFGRMTTSQLAGVASIYLNASKRTQCVN